MNQIIKLSCIKICCKNLSTTSVTAANNQQKNIINKMVFGKSKVKKKWYLDSTKENLHNSSLNSLKSSKEPAKDITRRVTILNKLFMKNITDLMATGSHSEQILGRQIEVSHVKVAPDFQRVNVFWLAKGDSTDSEIQTILDNAAMSIRHELSQLRVMGEVPKIYFVKDKQYAKVVEIENLIGQADLGNYPENDEEVDDKTSTLAEYDSLPPMRHDVFGLNHEEIMNRITKNMKKTKQAWEKYNYGGDKTTASQTTKVENLPVEVRNQNFKKFLERQQINRRIQYKNEKNYYVLLDKDDHDSLTEPHEPSDYIEEPPQDSKKL